MQVDSDPLKDVSMMYTDIVGCNMVEAIVDTFEGLSVKAEVETGADVVECQMVDITKDAGYVEETTLEPQFDEKFKATYPTAEEEQIDFLNRCRLKNSEVMLCPRCSVVFDKEVCLQQQLQGQEPHDKDSMEKVPEVQKRRCCNPRRQKY
jgi:hypothetical protein